uniref:Cyclin-F n=1 Tax=Astyanax mexicanus TaxID=7994 RepID=W5LHW9_ASTMX
MKAGVLHCRCSKCYSLPARKRVRKQTRSLTLLSLPEEVLLYVLQSLSAEDLLAVRAVHPQLRDIIDNNSSVWARVSFKERWPAPDTVWLFEKAAEKGNFEAAVKLGIAYLYNEGPLLSDEGRADLCGKMAARFFSVAESVRSSLADPFIWLFIRPPWSVSGSCCKAVVYDHLKAECDTNLERRGALLHCLARVLRLFDDEEKQAEAVRILEESSNCGSVQSSYLLWEQNRSSAMSDPGRYLQCLRTLRDYAAKGCWEAQLSLAKSCATGNPLSLETRGRAELVAQLFRSCPSLVRQNGDLHTQSINDTMRYILVDWLVEVTTMKDFSSLALHVTVGCVDRYLSRCSVAKTRLQLLGIACMVICTRYISKDILTIREAVWLTDNTYQYEDLVRMMGEVISVLEGKIRIPTLLDYGEVLQSLLPMERRSTHLYSYICELSLLCSPLSVPSPAHLACAILLLTRAIHNYAPVWPVQLVENTGFSKQDLVSSALLLYIKCFSQDAPKDYRHVSLIGVKQRFENDAYHQISKETVIGFKELCQVLQVPEVEPQIDPPTSSSHSADIHSFLSSPGSNSKRRREDSLQDHRGSFMATPTAELSTQEETLLGDILDWSLDASCSGYEGDQESEGERDAETSALAFQLQPFTDSLHCRALSSDDSMSEEETTPGSSSSFNSKPLLCIDLHSSGYSSVQSSSSSPSTSTGSTLVPCSLSPVTLGSASASASPGFRLLVPMQRPCDSAHRQVKRKNTAAHSGEGMEVDEEEIEMGVSNASFLS